MNELIFIIPIRIAVGAFFFVALYSVGKIITSILDGMFMYDFYNFMHYLFGTGPEFKKDEED